MKKLFFLIFPISIFCLAALISLTQAEILVGERSGNLSVTTPDGKLITVSVSDKLPDLTAGSVIEVLSGEASFSLEGPSFLTVVAGESVMNLSSGNQVKVNVNNNGADTITDVLSGTVEVSLGESILALRGGASIEAKVTEGKVSVALSKGEAAIVTLDGSENELELGKSYNLGSIVPVF